MNKHDYRTRGSAAKHFGAVPPRSASGTLRIFGNGTSMGGSYKRVKITGEGVILGDLMSESFSCMGNSRMQGNVNVGSFRTQGETTIGGELTAEELSVMGQMTVHGGFRSRKFKLRGQLESLAACEGGEVTLKGAFDVAGKLSADQLEVSMYGTSRAVDIYGRSVKVRRSKLIELKQMFTAGDKAELFTQSIEGSDIYLEYTTANVVRGNKVTIGPGCNIGLVEYKHSVSISKHAHVAQQIKG